MGYTSIIHQNNHHHIPQTIIADRTIHINNPTKCLMSADMYARNISHGVNTLVSHNAQLSRGSPNRMNATSLSWYELATITDVSRG